MLEPVKSKVLRIAKKAVAAGLVHEKAGNFSAYDKESNLVVITPSGIPREGMELSDLCIVDLDGKLVEGRHKPSSETPMHTEIYKRMTGVLGIVHTHSVFATAFAVAGKEIDSITVEMNKFGGKIPLVPFQLPGSVELGTSAIPFLTKHPVVLLQNHGLLAVGRDVDEALLNAIVAEDIAKIYAIAIAIGGAKLLSQDQMESVKEYWNMKGLMVT